MISQDPDLFLRGSAYATHFYDRNSSCSKGNEVAKIITIDIQLQIYFSFSSIFWFNILFFWTSLTLQS